MNLNLFVYFIPNLFLNSILSCLFSLLLIDLFLFLLRIKNFRIKYFFRLIPFLKLPIDLLLYNFSSWSFLRGISILSQEEGSRFIGVAAGLKDPLLAFFSFQTYIKNGCYFSLTDLLLEKIPYFAVLLFSVLLIAGSLISLIRLMINLRKTNRWIKNLLYGAYEITPLSKKKYSKIFITKKEGFSPFTCGVFKPKVIIPEILYNSLTDKERLALLYHEEAHVFWRDYLINLLVKVIIAFFWMNPIAYFQKKRLDFTRELACDTTSKEPLPIADVIYKTALHLKMKNMSLIIPFFNKRYSLLKRVKINLLYKRRPLNRFESLLATLILAYVCYMFVNSPLGLF